VRGLLELRRAWYAALLASPAVAPVLLRRPDFLPRVLDGGAVLPAIDAEDAAIYARRLARPEQARATTALYRGYFRTAVDSGLRQRYRDMRLTVPTRLILSTGDPAVPPALAHGVEAHADDLEVETVDDCGHFTPEERPELVVARALELFG
jgi:pimeloyl-ACP methyl ester carboxylesterase